MTDKIEVEYLGTTDWGISQFTPDNATFTIVSCSNANKIKRIDLIIEALKLTKFDVRWVHFGEGELLASLKEMAKTLPPNVTYRFAGQVRYRELMEYYRNNNINLFINTSSYEGLPVSAVEAASFGIPLMATDVYGTSEIVNENTGILLDANPSPEDIADKILSFKNSEMNSQEFRRKVRNYWSEKFNAQRVYDDFSTTLINEFTSFQKVRRMQPV